MTNEPTITPPNRAHLASLLLGAAAGMLGAAIAGRAMGAGVDSIEAAAMAIGAGTLLMAWPSLVRGPMPALRWGLLVIAGSSLRLVAIVAVAGLLDLALGLDRQGLWLGVAVGGMVQLAIETGVLLASIGGMRPGLAGGHGGAHAS